MGEDDGKVPLEGTRISILDYQRAIDVASDVDVNALELPAPYENKYWYGAGRDQQHYALSSNLQQAWRASIGKGSDDFPLIVEPIAANGFVYSVDLEGRLKKIAVQNGRDEWTVKVAPKDEDRATIGGGLSFDGRLYVATGFHELLALDPANGGLIWRYQGTAPFRAAPISLGGRVFAVSADSETFSLDRDTGSFQWRHAGLKEKTRYVGAAAPIATSNLLVVPYASGEVYGLRPENGADLWSLSLQPMQRFEASLSQLGDIQADPVLKDGVIYAMSASSVLAAIEARTGRKLWQHALGGIQTPRVVGDFLFVTADENSVYAFERETGKLLWVKELPRYEDVANKEGAILYSAPVLAGGLLHVVGSDGTINRFNPRTGEAAPVIQTGYRITLSPLVVNKTLVLVTDDGVLLAYR